MPLMPEPLPQGSDIAEELRQALDEAGMSKRALAKRLQQRRPRAGGDPRGTESWRNTLGRYLASTPERRQVPDEETAGLLEELLGRPPGFFVRRRGGGPLHEENARLRAELAEARRRIVELEESSKSGPAPAVPPDVSSQPGLR